MIKIKFDQCPLCESEAIHKRRGKRILQLNDRQVTTPVIVYWECDDCGEVFYPRETGKKLDEYFLGRAKQKVG